MSGAKVIDASLHLLDRQLIDSDDRHCGKVDDLELSEPEPGSGESPILVALLTGPGALSGRFGGVLGRWLAGVHRVLHPSEAPGPCAIPFGAVRDIDAHVQLNTTRAQLGLSAVEDWGRESVISHIPGADHATE